MPQWPELSKWLDARLRKRSRKIRQPWERKGSLNKRKYWFETVAVKRREERGSGWGRPRVQVTESDINTHVVSVGDEEVHPDGRPQQGVHHHPRRPAGSQRDHPHHRPANHKDPLWKADSRRTGQTLRLLLAGCPADCECKDLPVDAFSSSLSSSLTRRLERF